MAKTTGLFLPDIYRFEALLGGDKLMHLKLSFLLSIIACTAISNRRFFSAISSSHLLRLILLQLALVSCLLLDELHQYMFSSRRFEWQDFYYGAGGLLLGTVVYYICFTLMVKAKFISRFLMR